MYIYLHHLDFYLSLSVLSYQILHGESRPKKPTPYAWTPTRSGSRLAASVDELVALVNVKEGEESEVSVSSSSLTPAKNKNKVLIS